MKDSTIALTNKILILLLVYSQGTMALNCIDSTGFNLQCPLLVRSTCLDIDPASNNSSPYDLLCDNMTDCIGTGADERHAELSLSLQCGEFHYLQNCMYVLTCHLHACTESSSPSPFEPSQTVKFTQQHKLIGLAFHSIGTTFRLWPLIRLSE